MPAPACRRLAASVSPPEPIGIRSQLWVSWFLLLGTLVSALTLTEVKANAGQVAGPILDVLRQRKVVFLLGAGLLMTAAHGALYVFYSIHLVAQG